MSGVSMTWKVEPSQCRERSMRVSETFEAAKMACRYRSMWSSMFITFGVAATRRPSMTSWYSTSRR